MLIDNYRYIHIYKNCSADNAFSQFFDRRDVTHFLADYKGVGSGQRPSQIQVYLIEANSKGWILPKIVAMEPHMKE